MLKIKILIAIIASKRTNRSKASRNHLIIGVETRKK